MTTNAFIRGTMLQPHEETLMFLKRGGKEGGEGKEEGGGEGDRENKLGEGV